MHFSFQLITKLYTKNNFRAVRRKKWSGQVTREKFTTTEGLK